MVAANGVSSEVLRRPEPHLVQDVVELQVGRTSLVVSPDHRIVVPGNKTVKAEDLRKGSEVILNGAPEALTSLRWKHEPTTVLKLAFKPDLPVPAFMQPSAIFMKGSRDRPVLRRGFRSRASPETASPETGDAISLPDTDPGDFPP